MASVQLSHDEVAARLAPWDGRVEIAAVNGPSSVVIAGDTPRVTLTASTDSAEFERALRTIDQSAGHPDFADAFALAESLDTGSTPIGYVFVTDGGLADTEERLLPPGTPDPAVAATVRQMRRRWLELYGDDPFFGED